MNKAKVYFTNLRTTPNSNLLDKMERLVRKAGIADISFEQQFTAIKIHFGEPGNLAYASISCSMARHLYGPIMPPAWYKFYAL